MIYTRADLQGQPRTTVVVWGCDTLQRRREGRTCPSSRNFGCSQTWLTMSRAAPDPLAWAILPVCDLSARPSRIAAVHTIFVMESPLSSNVRMFSRRTRRKWLTRMEYSDLMTKEKDFLNMLVSWSYYEPRSTTFTRIRRDHTAAAIHSCTLTSSPR